MPRPRAEWHPNAHAPTRRPRARPAVGRAFQVFAVLSESGVARDDKLALLEAINSLEKAAM
eukprot:2194959-Prymnesium_polylepis.1